MGTSKYKIGDKVNVGWEDTVEDIFFDDNIGEYRYLFTTPMTHEKIWLREQDITPKQKFYLERGEPIMHYYQYEVEAYSLEEAKELLIAGEAEVIGMWYGEPLKPDSDIFVINQSDIKQL
jgi:hypothetical protein